ncbi:MAG: hypothetical protein GTN78_25750 [Gemmatimonadales bacterium]|nr:hypothetical protein [Gemmatimonadales bacterium]NIN12564.1 hypothetical protein [Gemmatimonadales bacterium]NIR03559.1 hypothetical protein [Gemmatimonadales bacterium]NIS65881.1 hypothetical protein [Gemmatimonadales bacterium]
MTEIVALPRPFGSRYGVPVISCVDATIFHRAYFTHCLQCTFCHDWCCQYGVDVDMYHYQRIQRHADRLEVFTGIRREHWFTGEYEEDPQAPGGGSMRTSAMDGGCVFLNRKGRGCLLHVFCLEEGIDYHELKSMVDCLFPITFYEEILGPADEVDDASLVCLDTGPTLYRGLRGELEYYFGGEFVRTLDETEAHVARS